jgi:hypothetical protein
MLVSTKDVEALMQERVPLGILKSVQMLIERIERLAVEQKVPLEVENGVIDGAKLNSMIDRLAKIRERHAFVLLTLDVVQHWSNRLAATSGSTHPLAAG